MSEHQSRDTQTTPQAQPAAVAAPGVSQTRRNLLRAGAIGAPALIALKPASVTACSCKLPSGFTVSGNASRGLTNCIDPSEVASTWRPRVTRVVVNGASQYRYYTRNNAVLTIHRAMSLSSLGINVGGYGGATVGDWLNTADISDTGLFMACYLSAWAHSNGSNFPAKEVLRDIWNDAVVSAAGYAAPNQSGVKWNKAQAIGYFKFLTAQA